MSSWPRQIYIAFWMSLIFFTVVTAIWLPGYLDDSSGSGYQLTDKSRPDLDQSLVQAVSTHFPVRAFDSQAAPPSTEPVRQAIPGSEPTAAPGLPERVVPGVSRQPQPGNPQTEGDAPRVTKRAWVTRRSSVYQAPETTAQLVGTVEPGTRVRWAATVGEGWEEVLMRDGRSVYLQAGALSFNSPESEAAKFQPAREVEEVDVNALPEAVNAFVASLGRGDVLRASTYLAPTAPTLDEASLGALAPLVSAADPRLDRIETGPGRADRVAVIGDRNDPNLRVFTTWQWSARQGRWLLLNWR